MSALTAVKRSDLTAGAFAFPTKRKLALHNAPHVRNAIARFDQVKDVTDYERHAAWKRV